MSGWFVGQNLSSVPLFPLPNVVLLPRAVLPLHIFEQRYKAMTIDALASDRLIAMALLRDGWQQSYHGRSGIEPVVCVGRILSWEKLPDGNYNFLLQGQLRARIVEEHAPSKLYRMARLEPLCLRPALEIDLEDQRRQMAELFEQRRWGGNGVIAQFRQLVRGPLPTADLADLAAFTFLDDPSEKQRLLADCDVRRRVETAVQMLQEWARHIDNLAAREIEPGLN